MVCDNASPRCYIRAPSNSATAQLFLARRQHGQVGEVATPPCFLLSLSLLASRSHPLRGGGRGRRGLAHERRAPSCAADWLTKWKWRMLVSREVEIGYDRTAYSRARSETTPHSAHHYAAGREWRGDRPKQITFL